MSHNCPICLELRSIEGNRLHKTLSKHDIKSAKIKISDNFTVIPSLGPLINGHCLIVPDIHVKSIGKYCLDHGLFQELEQNVAFIKNSFGPSKNSSAFLFEHGITNNDASQENLCSTSHAHLHILPLESYHLNTICKRGRYMPLNTGLDGIYNKALQHEEYLLSIILDATIGNSFCLKYEGIESQYFRKKVAHALGLERWNWKEDPGTNLLISTIEKFEFELQ